MSPLGHEVFNCIQLDSLLAVGSDIHVVIYGNYLSKYKNIEKIKITRIPAKYNKSNKSPLKERIIDIKRLMWIKRNIAINQYDYIVFSSYDILSLFVFRLKQKVFIINHNNVDQFNSKIKLYFTKLLPSNYEHIALNVYMERKLNEYLPDKKVRYIPHGYWEASSKMRKPEMLKEGERFIFCPVNRNHDVMLMNNIIHSSLFNSSLEQKNINLYVKSQLLNVSKGNIKTIGMLDDDEYNYMLTKAVAVLLPYGEEFKYRCSGILFESVARNTPIIATPREALKIFENIININFFNNDESLIITLENLQKQISIDYNKEIFHPMKYWKTLLNE